MSDKPSIYDEQLGWRNRPGYPGFDQLGFREHREGPIELGSILALGDSFTYGSEVAPHESWPAQLDRLLGVPVVNGGVGGYGIDQMVLWGERIINQVAPRLVVLSFIPPDVDRAGMSVFSGAGKPYFLTDGTLQNIPVPNYENTARLFRLAMHVGLSDGYKRVLSDDNATWVCCNLMRRLAQIGVPVAIVAQNGFNELSGHSRARVKQVSVLDAARSAGLMVIDTFDTVKALAGSRGIEKLYVNGTGHMTAFGNEIIARLIAGRISDLLKVAA